MRSPNIIIVEEQNNPSTEYFIAPAINANDYKINHFNFSNLPSTDELTGSIIIVIRYLPSNWIKLIEKHRHRLKALIFFMDDDVLDVRTTAGMPWLYRYKLAMLSARHTHWLKKNRTELWVSCPYLQLKYADWKPKLVLPAPPAAQVNNYFRVFYHGSPKTHKAEINWLRPVVEMVLAKNDRVSFEFVGKADVHKLFRGLSRVTVLHPMSWDTYKAVNSSPGRQVGLAPQLDLPFNRARSYTKFFDIYHSRAVGIFSPESSCAKIVSHNLDGLIVPLDPDAWAEAILHLANNPDFCKFLLSNAEVKIADLRLEALQTNESLLSNHLT